MQRTCITSASDHDTAFARLLPLPKGALASLCMWTLAHWHWHPSIYMALLSKRPQTQHDWVVPLPSQDSTHQKQRNNRLQFWVTYKPLRYSLTSESQLLRKDAVSINSTKTMSWSAWSRESVIWQRMQDLHIYPKTTLIQAVVIVYIEPSSIPCK